MSFGGFGGFGQNNQQQSSGFGSGGFGSSNTGGFGSTGFGSNTGGGFGNTSSGFGSGFGSNQTSLFGSNQNRTGFGSTSTSGGSLFGGNTATSGGSGFGGFGSGGFGSNTTGGGFGSKPSGFGTGTSTGFGSGTGFGSSGTTGFGGTGTAFNNAIPQSDGTASTPFNPVSEKDAGSTVTSVYQSISYMQPYQRYSFEELRLGDYNHGRRYGNASGQPGAFGTSAFGSTGFGTSSGFGSGGFGTTSSAPSGFGTQQQTAGGFGSTSTSTTLFGQNKPATSVFGGTSTSTQPSLFGGNTATSGGFGSNTGTSGFGSGTSLFGGNQQQQQNKGLFGSGTTSGFGSGGFGTNTSTGTSGFGTTTTSTPFGQQQQQTGGFGGFGTQNQNQNQNKPLFGGTGTQQQTGGSLFGGTNTGSSLFGQNNQQQQNQQQGTGSIFGGQQQQQKPGLFGGGLGSTTTTGTSTFGGFGTQNNQTGTSSLFGSTQNQQQQQQQQKPSLFGGSSLFGSSTTNQTGTSLFGGQNQQQQGGGLGGGSIFGGLQQNQQQQTQPQQQQAQQQQPAPGSFQASLLEGNPYGSQSIFSGLPAPNAPSPGPLATPLSASMKQKQRTPLPIHKITPNAANRLITPPRRQGYGFSYSTYGTPTSASSASSLNGSLLGASTLRGGSATGSFGRSFGKSFSTSSLRKSFEPESDSVLAPGALNNSSRYNGSNLKRLTIDRTLRTDLFQRPSASPAAITNGEESAQTPDKSKKRVSFDSSTNGALVRTESESPTPTAEELGFLRSIRKETPKTPNGVNGTAQPEMEQVRGNELATVPENGEATPNGVESPPVVPSKDPQPGEYWMKPSRAELAKMSREQLKRVEGFTVGRHSCGQVTFDRPVDLTTVDLDKILGGIVQISVRSITVYPDEAQKPPLGKGLNVPSTLRIENSWPRGRDRKAPTNVTSGPLFDKHIDRLRKVTNTEFVSYEKQTGVWTFRVPHFTTYGLDYEDEEGESMNQSTLSAGPDTPTPKPELSGRQSSDNTFTSDLDVSFSIDDSFVGSNAGVEDDTFEFKKRKIQVPGAIEDEDMGAEDQGSFLEDGSAGSTERGGDTESQSEVGPDEDTEMEIAGSFPSAPRPTAEQDDTTRSALNSRRFGTPTKPRLDLSGDWAEQLQRTISPRKQDRDALRQRQAEVFADRDEEEEDHGEQRPTSARGPKTFTTSIDLMNSLFAQSPMKVGKSPKKQKGQKKNLEWPYSKTPKTFASSTNQLSGNDVIFHQTRKPRWGPADSLITINEDPMSRREVSGGPWEKRTVYDEVEVREFGTDPESTDVLEAHRRQTVVRVVDSVPYARYTKPDFRSFIQLANGPSGKVENERQIWQLVELLFNDDIEDDISAGVPAALRKKLLHRIKKDRLSRLLESIIRQKHAQALEDATTAEERAFLLLTFHRTEDACKTLVESGNLHLATLIAQIGRDETTRQDMQTQIGMWREHKVYSEISEPIRALYELLAGNALRSEGRPTGAVEDRASTFYLSERFNLDWFQAFGLRLWYGISDNEPIEAAVKKFAEDLAENDEPAYPFPPHLEADRATLRGNPNARERESPLWVLLKVYAASMNAGSKVELPGSLLPEAVSGGNRLSSRLSFQLHQVLTAIAGDSLSVDQTRADQLTWNYAWELIGHGQMEPALFVLLHLSRAVDRERGIKEALAHFAAQLPEPQTVDGTQPDAAWEFLTRDLQIPESWIWVAKALRARADSDAAHEVDYLIRAKNWNEAHSTFCRTVAPRTVLEQDYATLRQLLAGFGDSPERKVRGWANGGAIYVDFLRLVSTYSAPSSTSNKPGNGNGSTDRRRERASLRRLVHALAAVGERIKQQPATDTEGLYERVAFLEMSRMVAQWCASDEHGIELSAILNLPLTDDARIAQTAAISRQYYQIVMAGAS